MGGTEGGAVWGNANLLHGVRNGARLWELAHFRLALAGGVGHAGARSRGVKPEKGRRLSDITKFCSETGMDGGRQPNLQAW